MLQLRFTNPSRPAIWLVAPSYSVGSNADCDCYIAHPGVAALHAEIRVVGEAVSLVRTEPKAITRVNGKEVTSSHALLPGDRITIGEAELAIADPKSEALKQTFPEKTNVRPSIAAAVVISKPEARWHLRPLNTTLANSEGFDLVGTMSLGRSKECDICIPASHLSRKHAKFSVTDKTLVVEDLGSSNGTFINGKRIHRIVLVNGDEVSFDTLRFRVEAASSTLNDLTTLRSAIDETQVRQAVHAPSPSKSASSSRKAPPVRPKTAVPQNTGDSKDTSSDAESLKLLLAAGAIVVLVVALAWFLLS
jgi:pSer/pThr/pTyr-binding forkhead associated (FHA) protein